MSDIAVGGILATDIFALGTDFNPQSSNVDTQLTKASARGADGDEVASQAHDGKTTVSCTYIYTGAGTLGVMPVTGLVVGKVAGGYHIDSVSCAFSNNGWPTITVTGHQHLINVHADGDFAEYTPSIDLPAGFGAADLFANAGATSSVVSSTYTLSATHQDVMNKDGNHLAGDNAGATETITAQYYGVPTLTTTDWIVTSSNFSDSNSDFDQVNISATKGLTRDA